MALIRWRRARRDDTIYKDQSNIARLGRSATGRNHPPLDAGVVSPVSRPVRRTAGESWARAPRIDAMAGSTAGAGYLILRSTGEHAHNLETVAGLGGELGW
jgi:hypothetical protein